MNSESKKIKVKVKLSQATSKLNIESYLNILYPDLALSKQELQYDLNIEEEFKKYIPVENNKVNLDIISNLPTLEFSNIEDDCGEDYLNDQDNDITNENIEEEIDKDSLEKESIGNKTYYFDYTKGIIYDLQFNIIGNIDELGEINIA